MPVAKLGAKRTKLFIDQLTHDPGAFEWEGKYTIIVLGGRSVSLDHGYNSYSHARRTVKRGGVPNPGMIEPLYFLLPKETASIPNSVVHPHHSDNPKLCCFIDYDHETLDVTNVTFAVGDRTLLTLDNGHWSGGDFAYGDMEVIEGEEGWLETENVEKEG